MRGFVAAAALCAIAAAQPDPSTACDPDYECKFSVSDYFGTLYEFDFSKTCNTSDYTFAAPGTPDVYNFNICGLTYSHPCLVEGGTDQQPVYGAVMQSFSTDVPNCTAVQCTEPITGNKVCCTPACEVLGAGEPIWALQDPYNPADGGVLLTYFGVGSTTSDPWPCKNADGSPGQRSVTIAINCDPTVDAASFVTDSASEVATCNYRITGRSSAACGCAPQCSGATCGSDGCGGSCGGAADINIGGCPYGYNCVGTDYAGGTAQQCCKPDCNNRDCGPDGCGGTCGRCGSDEECTVYSVCVPTGDEPQPNPGILPPTSEIVYYTDSGSLLGLYIVGAGLVVAPLFFMSPRGRAFLYRARTAGIAAAFRGGEDAQGLMAANAASSGETKSLAGSGGGGGGGGGFSKYGGGYGSTSGGGGAAGGGYGSASSAGTVTEL